LNRVYFRIKFLSIQPRLVGAEAMKRYSAVLAVAAVMGLGVAPANAIVWDLVGTNTNLGTSEDFTVNGITITAYGFTGAGVATDLFGKNEGAGETGIGLTNDPTTQNEISGTNFIQIDTAAARAKGVSAITFAFNSSTAGEGWLVFGSNTLGVTGALLNTGTDENDHLVSNDTFRFYSFLFDPTTFNVNNGNNVLLAIIDGTEIPLPGALPLFATGLGLMGLLGWRRKRKGAAVAA
jgi:hypothetical protein